jgi:sugar phosphate isomerase/epimerase
MFIDTMGRYEQLLSQLNAPHFKLTLDLGHLHCQGETPIADYLRRFAPHLANIHIEDMRRGVHEHLMFGEGEMEFPPIFAALREIDYQGGVYVELSRHSHEGPEAASRAMKFLRPLAQCE